MTGWATLEEADALPERHGRSGRAKGAGCSYFEPVLVLIRSLCVDVMKITDDRAGR